MTKTDFYTSDPDQTYNTRESIVCEHCKGVNITNVKINTKREKKPHMVYMDNYGWIKFKAGAADFGNMANFLTFLLGLYDKHRVEMNTPNTPESLEGIEE